MKHRWIVLLFYVLIAGFLQLLSADHLSAPRVMLAAVSRDGGLVVGGLGVGRISKPGQIFVEPIAYLSESGEWQQLPCRADRDGTDFGPGCEQFGKEYLSKPHKYTVVSADGKGAAVRAKPSVLSECGHYTADGTYSGASITRSAIAASNPEIFSPIDAPKVLLRDGAAPVLRAVAALTPKRLESTRGLKAISLRLENQDLIVIKREYGDVPETAPIGERQSIFAIATMEGKRFHVLHWKENMQDEDEGIIGAIRLKNGHDFLITSVRDCEGQWFRVYGIKNGKLTRIFSGGGASC
jgi:hypothetical protein